MSNNSLAANSLAAPSHNGYTSDNGPSIPSVNGKSSDKAVDVSVPETSTFTSSIQNVYNLVLHEIYSIYITKNPTSDQIKNTKWLKEKLLKNKLI